MSLPRTPAAIEMMSGLRYALQYRLQGRGKRGKHLRLGRQDKAVDIAWQLPALSLLDVDARQCSPSCVLALLRRRLRNGECSFASHRLTFRLRSRVSCCRRR